MRLFFNIFLFLLVSVVVVFNLLNLPEESFSPLLAWKRALFKQEEIKGTKHFAFIEWLEKGEFNIFIDETLYYSSYDLEKHLETYVLYPWLYQEKLKNSDKILSVAVVGPITGLVAQQILKGSFWGRIDFFTDDIELFYFFRDDPYFSNLTEKALLDKRIKIHKVVGYLKPDFFPTKYDFIYLNLPDPYNDENEIYYSSQFLQKISSYLTDEGILIVNGTSPFFTSLAYGKIRENLKSVFPWVKSFWLSLSQQGEWAYFMASFKKHSLVNLDLLSRWPTDSLTREYAKTLALYPKDLVCRETNFSAPLQKLYKDGWATFINARILEKSYIKD